MSGSLDDVNVISMHSGAASGESNKKASDGVVDDLRHEKTLIENSDDKKNVTDQVRVWDGEKILTRETNIEATTSGPKWKEFGHINDMNGRSKKRVVELMSRDDGWGMMNLVGRVLEGKFGMDKEVEHHNSSENKSGINLVVDLNPWRDMTGEPTSANGIDTYGTFADGIGTDGTEINELTDTVNLGFSGEPTVIYGKQDSLTNEPVPDVELEMKDVYSSEAVLLITEGYEKQDLITNELVPDGKLETKGVGYSGADVLMIEQDPITNKLVPDAKLEIEEVCNAEADVQQCGKQDAITNELVTDGKSQTKEVDNAGDDLLMTEVQDSIPDELELDGKLEIEAVDNAEADVLTMERYGRQDLIANELVPDGNSVIIVADNAEAGVLITQEHEERFITEYYVSDLVWGKVRSHPWWPGQIFAPSDASDKAGKYFKKDSYLIAYFGDRTFAWNEGSKIKPFRMNFSEMEKQGNAEGFLHAVSCALDEVSRRVEVGLSCTCLRQEVHNKIKTQVVVNAGIRDKSSRRDGGDSLSTASSFVPGELLQFLESLAEDPGCKVDRLQFAVMKAQLLGFNRWKGYYKLPMIEEFGELVEEDTKCTAKGEISDYKEVMDGVPPASDGVNEVPSKKRKSAAQDVSSRKCNNPACSEKLPNTKKKHMSVFVSSSSPSLQSGDSATVKRRGRKKKHEAVSSTPSNPKGKRQKNQPSSSAVDHLALQPDANIKVGERVCRALRNGEMSRSSGAGKSQAGEIIAIKSLSPDELLSKLILAACNPMQGYDIMVPVVGLLREFRNSVCLDKLVPQISAKHVGNITGEIIAMKSLTPDEILSKLSLAARNPMQGYDMMVPVVGLLRELRNSICLERLLPQSPAKHVGNTTDTFVFEGMEDSYWTDRVIQSSLRPVMLFEPEIPLKDGVELGKDTGGIINLDDEKEKDTGLAASETGGSSRDGNETTGEYRPTALILNFSNLESIPSVANLNEIFRSYGTLKESDTEILSKSKRAKVVFENRAAAEAAFSSTGKYRTFGPSLISYRLNYAPTPRKLRAASKRNKKTHP